MLRNAPFRPPERAFDRTLLVAARVHQRGQFIEREHDIGTDLMLDPHADFRAEPVFRAVERGFERDAVLIHEGESLLAFGNHIIRLHAGHVHRQRLLEARAQRQHLEPARIRERRAIPVHELRQPAGRVKHVLTRTLEQMERVRQQALRTKLLHGFRQDGFHRALRGDRHKGRRMNIAMRGMDDAGAPIPRASASFAVRGIRQTGDGFEPERATIAGLTGFGATGVFKQTSHSRYFRRNLGKRQLRGRVRALSIRVDRSRLHPDDVR